jgi:putative methionine-R-sulfoxide reductase with GAF domain
LRFGADGYIWINEFEKPYTVRLHPISPNLEGGDWVFYIEDSDVNVYEAFHDSIVAGNGEGKVSYNFYKPGSKERVPKLSFVKLYEPLGWVIGTGVYIDHIDKIVAKKTEEMETQISNLIFWVFIIGIIIIALASIALYLFGESITLPIYQIQNQLYEMSKGKIVSKLDITRKDEIGSMKKSLDELIEGFSAYSQFAIEIGKGNFESKFTTLSSEDVIGNSLLEMRTSLKIAQHEENKRNLENAKRQWTSEGLTLIGDVLRVNSSDIRKLCDAVLVETINYLKANQGGIFLLNEVDNEDIYLELMASVAYSRKKYLHKRINPGDGLIGACFLEKERIYMTNIPNEYLEIKSGLGTSNPRNLLIVPLMLEDNVLGIIELASFRVFDEHEIEFIEKIAQSMAVSISTSKVSGIYSNTFGHLN